MDLSTLTEFARQDVDPTDPRYREPLHASAPALLEDVEREGAGCEAPPQAVLLRSIAAETYLDPVLDGSGARLFIPPDFVERGDMSRGGLLLRAARSGTELPLVPARGAHRTGCRPPPLPRRR